MNTADLERILRSVAAPERDAEYWEGFPAGVTRRLRLEPDGTAPRSARRPFAALIWGLGLATACLVAGFAVSFWNDRRTRAEPPELVALRTCFREIETLFPNQVQAIVIDEQGLRLVLAETANVPRSPPLFVKICGPAGCQRFLTFSGQQIRVNGETYEVLADGDGGIILLGANSVWASTQRAAMKAGYEVEARSLETTL